MTIHVSATTGCNLGCTYCYENPDRERKQEWVDRQYDMDKIIEQLDNHKEKYPNEAPGLHGGEPLLIKKEDMRTMFAEMEKRWPDDTYHIQTNATLIEDEHVDIFNEYGVHLGISCDGPPELNTERKAAGERGTESDSATNSMSERTNDAIFKYAKQGVSIGVITVLHKTNAGTEERFETLLEWIDELNQVGVSGHFNPAIPYEDVQEDISLDPSTLKDRFLRTWEWMKQEPHREWNPMGQYVDNLLGNGLQDCVNAECNVFNAGAAKIIKGDGGTTGCGKTWSAVGDGVPFLQGIENDSEYDEVNARYRSLIQTPGPYTEDEPDMGGCKGCKYWNVCKGGCPSSGMDYDYRNRTIWCEAKYALYEKIEQDIRAILPNVRLITDYPWDKDFSEFESRHTLDIKPFEGVRPGSDTPSSAYGGGGVKGERPYKHEGDKFGSWQEMRDYYVDKYGEDAVEVDHERQVVHADQGRDSGWEEVD